MTTTGSRLRLALFGSPAFALPTLEALHAHHALVLVVTQPVKRAGRGMRPRQPAAAERAAELGVPVEQPRRLRHDAAFEATLRGLDLDVAITAAYGKLLPPALLAVPRHGFLNVHASLLPKYRGAAPIQWALIRGERETGVSIMQTDAGLDTGPVRHMARRPILAHETAADLFPALAELGAQTLLEALELLAAGALGSVPQDEAAASLAPLLTTEDGRIRWSDPAQAVYDRFRGVIAWPGSFFHDHPPAGDVPAAGRVKVTRLRPAEPVGAAARAAAPGTVLSLADDGGLEVACGAGGVWLERLRPAGRQEMAAAAWAHGRGVRVGVRLG